MQEKERQAETAAPHVRRVVDVLGVQSLFDANRGFGEMGHGIGIQTRRRSVQGLVDLSLQLAKLVDAEV